MARSVLGPNRQTSNTVPPGVSQGTPGGKVRLPGMNKIHAGDEMYLWILLFIEVALMGFLRNHFRRYHGG